MSCFYDTQGIYKCEKSKVTEFMTDNTPVYTHTQTNYNNINDLWLNIIKTNCDMDNPYNNCDENIENISKKILDNYQENSNVKTYTRDEINKLKNDWIDIATEYCSDDNYNGCDVIIEAYRTELSREQESLTQPSVAQDYITDISPSDNYLNDDSSYLQEKIDNIETNINKLSQMMRTLLIQQSKNSQNTINNSYISEPLAYNA